MMLHSSVLHPVVIMLSLLEWHLFFAPPHSYAVVSQSQGAKHFRVGTNRGGPGLRWNGTVRKSSHVLRAACGYGFAGNGFISVSGQSRPHVEHMGPGRHAQAGPAEMGLPINGKNQ